MHAGGSDFNVLPIAQQSPKKSFSHGAATDISGTNEQDAFHDSKNGAMPVRQPKIKPNQVNAREGRASSRLSWHVEPVEKSLSPLEAVLLRVPKR
jgi:hypothetical protein